MSAAMRPEGASSTARASRCWLLARGPQAAAPAAAGPVTVHFGVIAEEPNEPDRMFTVYSPCSRSCGSGSRRPGSASASW